MEQHGGSITVHSLGANAGTTFTIALPLFLPADGEEVVDYRERDGTTAFMPPDSPKPSFHPFERETDTVQNLPNTTKEPLSLSFSPSPVNAFQTSSYEYSQSERLKPPDLAVSLSTLVVDDSSMNRKMVCRVLHENQQFVCEQAEDGRIAVEMVRQKICQDATIDTIHPPSTECGLQKTNYDLILMDYQMPNMDGPTAIAEIRKLGFKGIILGLTGNALQIDKESMLAAGADGVLVKPLNIELLWKHIRKLLDAKKR